MAIVNSTLFKIFKMGSIKEQLLMDGKFSIKCLYFILIDGDIWKYLIVICIKNIVLNGTNSETRTQLISMHFKTLIAENVLHLRDLELHWRPNSEISMSFRLKYRSRILSNLNSLGRLKQNLSTQTTLEIQTRFSYRVLSSVDWLRPS